MSIVILHDEPELTGEHYSLTIVNIFFTIATDQCIKLLSTYADSCKYVPDNKVIFFSDGILIMGMHLKRFHSYNPNSFNHSTYPDRYCNLISMVSFESL